jgi:hypothetical protein
MKIRNIFLVVLLFLGFLTVIAQLMIGNIKLKNDVKSDVEYSSPEGDVKIEKITNELTSRGMFKVKVDDTTTVLVYHGYESCTMIRLK